MEGALRNSALGVVRKPSPFKDGMVVLVVSAKCQLALQSLLVLLSDTPLCLVEPVRQYATLGSEPLVVTVSHVLMRRHSWV